MLRLKVGLILRRFDLRWFDLRRFELRRFNLLQFDIRRFDLLQFDLLQFDLRWLDLLQFDLHWFDLREFDLRRLTITQAWNLPRLKRERGRAVVQEVSKLTRETGLDAVMEDASLELAGNKREEGKKKPF